MGINLTGTNFVSWGVPTFNMGLSAMTHAVTIKMAASQPNTIRTLFSQLGDTQAEQRGFQIRGDSNKIMNFVATNGTGFYWGDDTATGVLTTSTLCRIVCTTTLNGVSSVNRIWLNGVEQTGLGVVSHQNPGTTWGGGVPTARLTIGACPDFDGTTLYACEGDYSDAAIWDHAVPDWVAEGYGKGMSPQYYRIGGLFYATTVNTSAGGIIDSWGGRVGTNSGGTDAAHPPMFYP